jgi:EAL and modified HD-GYP domain-containing signal transduction protein
VGVEILEDILPDDQVLGICRGLREAGFTIAMDDFVFWDQGNPLIQYADIVKVDFMGTTPEQRHVLCRDLNAVGVRVLAEKVETAQDFDQAFVDGYSLFQGYFFSKPVVQGGKHIAGSKLTYLQVLYEVNQPGISYDDLEGLLKQDISLTYKLLRFMNSAWFGFRSEIRSIRHALILLGPKEIKKWFALIALSHIATDKPQELILRAVARARVAEGLAPLVGMADRRSDLFLLGMFSLIDALTDTPMADIMAKLPLDQEVKTALLEQEGRYKPVYDLIVAYEKGEWALFAANAGKLGLDESAVPDLMFESLKWANEAFAAI